MRREYELHVLVMGNIWSNSRLKSSLKSFRLKKVVGDTYEQNLWNDSQNNVQRLQSNLEGIGSSHQAGCLTMNETIQQIKEQVLNFARRQIASCSSRGSSPTKDTDDSGEDEYIESTP
ncbi:hypothetical protein H5410_002933 [Solanum commersonii]|uniref:Uncharacterized protein n=1 Tax=Solanum commersonii TaxID=4109 RepID=A0A9J6B3L3_SOLCO|nr:hypothetical protein H5410_002933 [Solanum commersonii]